MGMDDHEFRLLTIPPPIHPEDPDSPLPETILLDSFGYLSDRTNATTANGRRSRTKKKGKRILVTFWPATPPRVSCFTVHCPDLRPDAYGSMPKVCYTEDGLALLRITICPARQYTYARNIRYFVYQSGARDALPSLKLVHSPPDLTFFDREVALLRCRDLQDTFFIAVLRMAFIDRQCADTQFDLHLYNSKAKKWSTKLVHLDSPPQDFEFRSPNKGITIGGELGSVGWVDLRRGILICDLLIDNNQSLRYIPLPPPLSPDPLQRYPLSVRNIVVLQGYIKYFEMHNNIRPGSEEGWIAATKKFKISSIGSTSGSNWNWEEECTIRCSDEVPVDSPVHAQMLLPDLQEGEDIDTKPNLKRISVGYPAPSLHDGDVVYLMHMPDPREGKACERCG